MDRQQRRALVHELAVHQLGCPHLPVGARKHVPGLSPLAPLSGLPPLLRDNFLFVNVQTGLEWLVINVVHWCTN